METGGTMMMVSRRRVLSDELRMTLGQRLREVRISRRESQEAVAWAADVTQGSISNYEAGRNEVPLSVLMSICEYFNIPLSEMLPKGTALGAMDDDQRIESRHEQYPSMIG